jgi:hypothetical protein
MQISLKQRDIELALKMYLSSQGIALAGRTFEIEFTAGRKDNGLSVQIDIGPAESLAQSFVDAVIPMVPEPVEEKPMFQKPAPLTIDPEAKSKLESLTPPPVTTPVVKLEVVEELVEVTTPQEDPEIPAPWMTDEPAPAVVVEEAEPAPKKVSLFA